MKKLLMALSFLPLMAMADTEMVDGIEWTYAIIGDRAQVGDGLSTNPAIPPSTAGAITIPSMLGGYPVTSIGDYAFYRCDGLMQVIIPNGVTDIGLSAFYKCEKLDKIDLPSSLRSIDAGSFWGCRALTSISIPAGVDSIGSSAFAYCSALTTITVDLENRHYMAVDNCLYTKDGGSLLLYRGNSSKVGIPANVLNIGGAAFSTCGFVTIEIPLGVTNIGVRAFAQCSKLTAVTIPKSVTSIEERIFDECYALRTVYVDVGDVDRMRKMLYEAHPEYGAYFDNVSIIELSATGLLDSPLALLPGEAVSIDTGLIGYTAKGLPSGLKYDKKTGKITGAAKKPTAAEGVTVKFTKKGEPDAERTIVVGPMPKLSIALVGDTEKCKVKGEGAYLVGKKVSLSATAPKGTAFVGWFANGAPWPNEADCRKAKLSYVMTRADVSLVAKFEKERMSVGCAGLEGRSFTVGVAGGTGIPLEIETQSGVKSVKVSKLPAGMKYNAKTGLIEGAPTKAGDFTVQIAVTAKSGAVEKKDIAIHVDPLPDWAVGTFSGMIGRRLGLSGEDGAAFYGSLQFTVKATGAVAAKVMAGGKTYSFSAKGFRGVEDGDAFLSRVNYLDVDEVACRVSDTLVLDLESKKGDALLLGVTLFQKSEHLCVAKVGGTFVRSGCDSPYGLVAWRNEAGKDSRIAPGSPAAEAVARLKNLGKVYLKARELEPRADGARHFSLDWRGGEPLHRYGSKEADVTLSVDKSGNVKLSGKIDGVRITASTPLRISGNEWFSVTADSIAYDKKSGMDYEFTLGWDTVNPHTGVVSVTPDPNADPLSAGPDMHGFELRIEPFE